MGRLVLVHGSLVGGRATWSTQRRGLEGRVDLLIVDRPGFPPGPPVERIDFERDAAWLADLLLPGDHLVGHSYGGVVTLLAAAQNPDTVGSLTVLEPPCTGVAAGTSEVDAFAAGGRDWWDNGPREPEAFLRGFLDAVGSDYEPPSPLPAELELAVHGLMGERGAWDAVIPLDRLAAAPFPKLVVSGAHHAAFDAICDTLERELPAQRQVFAGFGHNPQLHPDFNAALFAFVTAAERRAMGGGGS